MSRLSTMTGAGGTLRINNKTYICTHLPIADISQIQEWLKQKLPDPWAVVKDAFSSLQGLPEAEIAAIRNIIVPAAHADAKAGVIDLQSHEAVTQLSSPEGMSLMIWLSVRRNQSNVTYDDVFTDLQQCTPKELEDALKKMIDIVQESLGTGEVEGMQSGGSKQIINPMIPPDQARQPAAEGITIANKIGENFTSASSKTSTSFRRPFPK